jgi:hypothetical protein
MKHDGGGQKKPTKNERKIAKRRKEKTKRKEK